MVNSEFAEASAELIEILKYLPKSEVEKIPVKLRTFFGKAADSNYVAKIDPYKSLDKQEIKEKTKDLIAVIYRNYWCNEEERKKLDQKLIENDNKYEEQLREKYNPNDIFKTKKEEQESSTELTQYKPQNFTQRLFNKIKNIFRRNK